MHICILAGSGKNGKTTLIKELAKLAQKEEWKHSLFFSTTRETFARLGLTTESAGLERRAEEQYEIQNEVLKDYLTAFEQHVNQGLEAKSSVLFCDRSPYDYLGYALQSIPSMNLSQIEVRAFLVKEKFSSLIRKHQTTIWQLPVKGPWEAVDDGYRYAPAAKNIAWNFIVQCLLEENTYDATFTNAKVMKQFEKRNSEERAFFMKEMMLDLIKLEQRNA